MHTMFFRCHYGHFKFLVIPFIFFNTPATFQACMNHVFNYHLWMFILVFFDDILVYNITWEDQIRHLDEVLGLLEANYIYAKDSKCEFGMKNLLYLGYVIGIGGVKVDREKIQVIFDWLPPRTLTHSRGSWVYAHTTEGL